MNYVEWLEAGPYEVALAGGKGAALSRLISGGFAVPEGFVINTSAFRQFVAETELAAEYERVVTGEARLDRDRLRAASLQLQTKAVEASMPPGLQDQVLGAYAELQQRGTSAVAVRSSATGEDGAGQSFAGLFDTYLNVTGPDALIDALRRCFASMWSERALGYSTRQGSGVVGDMAVVVMQMIPAETSGVVFTANPVTGDRSQVLINATWGLGEAIVSGSVTPDSYVFAKDTLALLEQQVSTKELGIFAAKDGSGVVETELDARRAGSAALDEDAACEVARVACQVESYFGSPQDIEFAISGGKLYILQSRPITTL